MPKYLNFAKKHLLITFNPQTIFKMSNNPSKLIVICALLLVFTACKKSNSSAPDPYMTLTAGSTWNYQQTNNSTPTPVVTNYTISSTTRDSSINGKSYHVFTNSNGPNQYYNVTGSDYFQFDSIKIATAAQTIDRLYLKDGASAGVNWVQNVTITLMGIPLPVVITNTVAEKGIARTVNSISYTDVIHLTTSITINNPLIPPTALTTNINSYYARKFGLIENSNIVTINFMGLNQNVNTTTKLISATLH